MPKDYTINDLASRWIRRLRRSPEIPDDIYAGPIRGELLGADRLAERAKEVARAQRPERRHRGRRSARLLNRLSETRHVLEDVRRRLSSAATHGSDVGPAAEWLLDNFHVVDDHIREVRESLPRHYYRELPQLSAGPLAGYPRVYELAIALIAHREGRIDLEGVDIFTSAFQKVSPLSIGELWAVPAMLRLGLIENIRRMALRTVKRLDEVEAADRWAERIHHDHEDESVSLSDTFDAFLHASHELTPTFVSRFLQQLRLRVGALSPLLWVEHWIADADLSPDDAAARATERLALTTLTMSNSITSLRAIAQRDWRLFVEHQSVLERVLLTDPAGWYGQMTFGTRDSYRHAVERISKRTGIHERVVAERATQLAREAVPGSREAHVGYYLVDRGAPAFEVGIGYRPPLHETVRRTMLQLPNAVFVGGIIAGTAMALAAVFWLGGADARSAWLAVLLVSFLPANNIAINLVNQLVTGFIPPRSLARLDLRTSGVPDDCRTAVVVPTLFDSVDDVQESLRNLEVEYLANHGKNLYFAVLSDFTDAASETLEADAAIVAAAADGVRALNERYAPETNDAFYLFHRPRRWNDREGVWMGWERKRGKLSEFNQFVRDRGNAFSTIVGDVGVLKTLRYVITLDSDTMLPPDAAPRLIGTIAHPLNRAVYDERARRIVDGYGILQPRVGVSLASAQRSRFASAHSGHPGVDPYTTAVSDVYQDLYGEGSFTGKGIYDIDAFERATLGRFPTNTLLSHDLIEGNYARAGLVTDVIVYDDYPTTYITFSRRKHRWIRGDWQLLKWLGSHVPGPDGVETSRLSLLSRWKIIDNLRRSVIEIAQFVFLVAGWTILPGSPIRWTLLGCGAIAAPWIMSLLVDIVRPPRDRSLRAYYGALGHDALASAQQFAMTLVFLPHQAWLSADAITRALWRQFISKRHLLQWQPAALAERATARTFARVWRAMWRAVVASGLVLPLVVAWFLFTAPFDRLRLIAFVLTLLPLAVLWLFSPVMAHTLSKPFVRAILPITDASRTALRRYARAHWEYFERFVTVDTHWLAPDNFQEVPEPIVAGRTSPTNIGLQLLATISAYDFEFITLPSMTERLERAFASMARLSRYRGHFYNWYDLVDLRVLEPTYISTVDSGNLAGHLIALRQACLELRNDANAAGDIGPRLDAIAAQAEAYVHEMEFGFLYDPTRKLLSIGYQPSLHTLDVTSYDLLASEARVASFVAIAKNDVPFEHWFRLGRTLIHTKGETALVSWSGSMFEYLMPSLILRSYPQTMLGATHRGAVARQISYAHERDVPWGMSESAYNVRDRHATYQYRAFGVPDLALKRGIGRDVVVAPYATALATMIDPEPAVENLRRLERMQLLGAYGFYDAVDYTRPDQDARYSIVKNFMAHHVGMTMVALANTVLHHEWQRRFHTDPRVRAAALLLDERVPRRLDLQGPRVERVDEKAHTEPPVTPVVRDIDTPNTRQPHVALLGHVPFTLMVSHTGGGYSRYEDIAVTRWRPDDTSDATGQACYVRDVARERVWSVAHQPVCAPPDQYRALLATDRVTLQRADGEIETRTEIVVVPEDAAEVRQVTVSNNGHTTREIELTSYGEIVLAPLAADRAHPAFGNLFVETEWHEWCTAITAMRRPRVATERTLWCVHVVDRGGDRVGRTTCETDRARFIGRGRSTRDPVALEEAGDLSGTTGAVLDPIFAVRTRVRLEPGQSSSVTFTTIAATSKERALQLADRYHDPYAAQRALDLAWTSAQIELRELDITPGDAAVFQDLAGHLCYPTSSMRVPRADIASASSWQETLWANGISGDWPIVVAVISSLEGLKTLKELFAAHRYWRRRGMTVDLIVVDEHPHSYRQSMNDRITELMLTSSGSPIADVPGGVFIRRHDALSSTALETMMATARVQIECDGRPLSSIIREAKLALEPDLKLRELAPVVTRSVERRTPDGTSIVHRFLTHAASFMTRPLGGELTGTHGRTRDGDRRASVVDDAAAAGAERAVLTFDNGFGGLTGDGAYQIRVRGDHVPPAPWANVIANARGGCIVTERGAGCTWAGNSYFFRLTPWHNDPVSDPPSEVIYLRDEDTGDVWTPTLAPMRRDAEYVVEHRPGASSFAHHHAGIDSLLTIGMAGDEPAKVSTLRITNRGQRARRISVTAYVEWTLGVAREQTHHRVRTTFDADRNTMFARNHFDPQFAQWVAYCALSERVTHYTADRREFIGINGTIAAPAGLRRDTLYGTTGLGVDACAAMQCIITLNAGESREMVVLLGAAPDEASAQNAVDTYREAGRAIAAVQGTRDAWERRLGTIAVQTPDPAFDAMLNRWSLYQALACRMWARSAVYQSSGAYGFRDQLQDSMAFVYAEPGIARAHILRCAARQFVEGDVQHWWHPESGRGTRTRFSDDLVWLPYVVEQYVRVTGDVGVLDEPAPFLTMRALEPQEHEVYDLPQPSTESASIYEHCMRALKKACTTGAHGLPLIGSGDWNDGMNRIGAEGRGESVWLAWFLVRTLRCFASLTSKRDVTAANELRAQADSYVDAVERNAWDGKWYRRAYYDDGSPLGSAENEECRIDSIAQSWSVISGAGQPERQARAMQSLEENLVLDDARLIMLLTPPFRDTPRDPGYIKGYLPGVRENGAQYTHAALWAVLATALRGEGDRAFELYQMLNPFTHASTPEGVATYKVEPYVVAADVYTTQNAVGRGGWTWYTGSASWMYRVGLEAILGFVKAGTTLRVKPRVPASWPEIRIEYRYGRSVYAILVHEPARVGVDGADVTVDGTRVEQGVVPLVDDGQRHDVVIRPLSPAPASPASARREEQIVNS